METTANTNQYYIVKTKENKFEWRTKDYFKGRLERQTKLNLFSDKKIFKGHPIKDTLNNFCKEIRKTDADLSQTEQHLSKILADNNGIYLKNEYEIKMQIILSELFYKN